MIYENYVVVFDDFCDVMNNFNYYNGFKFLIQIKIQL